LDVNYNLDARLHPTAYNTAYTLRAISLALQDIAPYGRNVVYAQNVIRHHEKKGGKVMPELSNWKETLVIQRDPKLGCIPAGYEWIIRFARIET